MIGIVSYGGYIPRLRLNRMSIYQQIGWLAPALIMVAQGERSMCNWDEDSLTMAVASARDCLKGMDKRSIDALYLASTTMPFADRLNAGIVATALNLRPDISCADLSSTQRAGTTALVMALEAAANGKTALVTAADRRETRAASFYEMWFGDGAASLMLGSENLIAEFKGSHSVTYDFVSHYRAAGRRFDYTWEERWVRDQGYARIIPEAIERLLSKLETSIEEVDKVIYPCFIEREHARIARAIGADKEQVASNLHAVCGETGSAHPLAMLIHALEEARPGDRIVVASFGQGCDALCFEVTEHIQNLPPRKGIQGSLEEGVTTDNYMKFLKFRDLIETEAGIRAEAPDQTAMTTLWRKREMILGLVGGKCTVCGTPQYPKADVCVNPNCGALHSQEDYEFADIPATVKSFTGDNLAVSVDPPAIYGMIQFDGGGRFMADFTDCEMGDLSVGTPVEMAFRRHYVDEERGFTGYFWKAVPRRVEAPVEDEVKAEEAEIRFDDQVAVVTGAGGGLGRIYALELAKRGARVVVNDLGGARDGTGTSSRPADDVVREITDAGGTAVASYDSVTTTEGGHRIVQTAIDHFGRLDILINNAGILRDKSFAKMEPGMWQAVLDVHLHGAFNVTQPAFQAMRKQGYGRIVLTTSAAGLFGNFGQANYSAAKLGLVGLMNTLKIEGAKYDIKVNTVAPLAATRLTEDVLPPDFANKLKPGFVAPLVLYLCSEQCPASGGVYNAGMGQYSRATVVSGPGIWLDQEGQPPEPEMIAANWGRITSLRGAEPYQDANAALMDMLAGPREIPEDEQVPVQEGAAAGAPAGVQAVFDNLPGAFQPQAASGVDIVFQFLISGPGGGEWYITIRDGACEVQSGTHEKPTTTLKMSDGDFLQYISGKLPAMQAYSSGKLKIEGDLMKSQLVEKLFKF
ncbi:MAG: SDR family NAD(P)-dependent oxidoreductase [Anaerolineae bacterium]|jgi:3-hydroxy-3-methylglutaryl CoA synthase/NAD(P)-dependent dehydrogenase (short-subunit alcohol dehydrogenase family)/putative sterol carrier protein